MRLWQHDLTVSSAAIESGLAFCATLESSVVGFYVLSREGPAFELEHLWIDAPHIGCGYGATLFAHALDTVRSHGGTSLRIASDPNAEPFYRRMGAHRIGEESSIPAGRTIPVLMVDTGR
jgi:GNAT superfamily N-acetyltransferase